MKKKFGELLIERRLITPEQLADALSLQRRRGMRLGAALVARGHITEKQLVDALGSALGLKVVDLSTVPVSSEAIGMINVRFAQDHDLFPYALRKERGRKVLSIAMSDPLNFRVIDELGFMTNAQIETVLAKPSDIDAAITKHYNMRFRASEAYGRDANGEDLLSLASAEGEKTTMTILRKGGGEEIVETQTGKVISPFIKAADGTLIDNPEVNLPPDAASSRSEEISAVLLTEEVADSTPLDAVQQVAVAPRQSPAPVTGRVPAQQPGMVNTGKMPVPNLPGPAAPGMVNTGRMPVPNAGIPPAVTTAPNLQVPSYAQGLSQPLPAQVAAQQQAFRTQTGSMPAQGLSQPLPAQVAAQQQAFRTQTGSMPVQGLSQPLPAQVAAQQQAFRTQTGSMPLPGQGTIPPGYGQPATGPVPVVPSTGYMQGPAPGGGGYMQGPGAQGGGFLQTQTGSGSSPYFDDALGALLDAAGGAVNAEAFLRLERKFWALMRLLAKKGLISNEEFMKELGETEE